MEEDETRRRPPTIRDLYPGLTEEELRETEENMDWYLELALRIYGEEEFGP